MVLSAGLLTMLQTRYGLDNVRNCHCLQEGDWNHLWRLEADQGIFVLRWSHPGASLESVSYEYGLTRFLQTRIPQVLTPLTGKEGFPCMLSEGRVVTLFPFLNGRQADRESAALRANAAGMLARLHRETGSFPSAGFCPTSPSLRELDWDRNPMWDWKRVSTLLSHPPHRAAQGRTWSPEYTLHNLLALENLKSSQPLNEITP